MRLDSVLAAVVSYLSAEEYAGERPTRREARAKLTEQVHAAKVTLERARVIDPVGGPFKRILVAVDDSLPAKWAAEVAAKLAVTSGAKLALVHAIRSAPDRCFGTGDGITEPLDVLRQRASDLLRSVEGGLPGGPCAEKKLVAGTEPTREIVQAALDWGADLIVIGTHGRGRFSNFILGSTAEAIIRRATCPVLTIAHDPVALRKVKDLLDGHHVRYVSIVHSPAYTSQEVAQSAHIKGREIAKTTMVKLDGELAMVVVPSNERVDLDRVRKVAGAANAQLASEPEFRGLFPDCDPGAMPPFGNLYGLRVFVSNELAKVEQIAFNAGSHTELIRMTYKDYQQFVNPIVAQVTCVPTHSRNTDRAEP